MRLMSIASGSSGNCIYAGYESTNLLIDAGISAKRIEEGLNSIGEKLSDMDGILITHEHSDHINGLKTISKKHRLPLYATRGTIDGILKINGMNIDPALFIEVQSDREFTLKDIVIDPIKISHDAAEPVCYRFYACDGKGKIKDHDSAAVCTDLGVFDDYIIEKLKGVSSLLLEANHDIRMLEAGPYPYFLKKRILGDKGHLSNDSAGELLSRLMDGSSLKNVLLGHLSKENNYAALAYETVRMQLKMFGNDTGISLGIAPRDVPGKLIISEVSYA